MIMRLIEIEEEASEQENSQIMIPAQFHDNVIDWRRAMQQQNR